MMWCGQTHDACDHCGTVVGYDQLKKIEIDWDGTFEMVCPACIAKYGVENIECRTCHEVDALCAAVDAQIAAEA